MKTGSIIFYSLIGCLQLFTGPDKAVAQQKITDTIYYNEAWQICEAPIAYYYRVGSLAALDNTWFYIGKARDYTTDNLLIMEGEYDSVGRKHGPFKFYYPDGKLQASGNYEYNNMFGRWHWYYPSGKEQAEIYFNGYEQDFKFISFKNEEGEILMENGIGKFMWPVNAFSINSSLNVNGYFNNGKRSGNWEFSMPGAINNMYNFREIYNDEGVLTKTKSYTATKTDNLKPYAFVFTPARFRNIEGIWYDDHFRKNGVSKAERAFVDYITDHKSTALELRYNNFDSVYPLMLKLLRRHIDRFDYLTRYLDADIEFRLGNNGFPENITVTGTGITERQKKLIVFLIKQFTNIDMPSSGSMAIEGYHHIYLYNINVSDLYPNRLKQYGGMELFVSAVSRKKMQTMLEANKKNIKEFIRDQMYGH